MMSEPRAMQEIHEIRERLSEETNNMTPTEYNARVRSRSQRLLDRYGIILKRLEPPKANAPTVIMTHSGDI